MNIISIATMLIGMLGQIPVVGHVLQVVMPYVIGLPSLVSGFVLLWQAVVKFLQVLGAIPGLSFMNSLAATLQADEAKVDSFDQATLLPLLNQISAIPVPAAPVAAAPAAPAAPAASS